MNGFSLKPILKKNSKDKDNIFDYRKRTYSEMLSCVINIIDGYSETHLEDLKKKNSVYNRECPINIQYPNFSIFYKGVEIPLLYKSMKSTVSGVNYIPVMQMVDTPVHSQKNGKYIIVKTNIKNSFLKMVSDVSNVILSKGEVPLLILLFLSMVKNKNSSDDIIKNMKKLGYEETDSVSKAGYLVPFYTGDISKPIIIKGYVYEKEGNWRDYLLSAFKKENINNHMLLFKTCENIHDLEDAYAKLLPKYHQFNKKRNNKHKLSINYIKTISEKILVKDLTLNNISVFDTIMSSCIKDSPLPVSEDIGDLNQKIIRHLEWYPMKISNVRSYPQPNMIVEVFKVEQRLNYDNNLNPISELEMATQIILFGKGALPKESCQSHIRNIHESYYGIIDPADSPSGAAIGISLHLVPEIESPWFSDSLERSSELKKYFNLENLFSGEE